MLHTSVRNHPGVCAAQAAHAATECLLIGDVPVPGDTSVCVLEAETAASLEMLHVALEKAGVRHVIIREPDEPYRGSAVAVGLPPVDDRDTVRPLLQRFKPLRKK